MSAPSRVREITLIIVSWSDTAELSECLESLALARARIPSGGPRLSLVLVHNEAGAGTVSPPPCWPDAQVLVNAVNAGLGPAANQASSVASGDVLLFLNPDTRPDGEPFSSIARGFNENPEAVALAPRLTEADGKAIEVGPLTPPDRENQFTFQLRRFPTLARDLRELLLLDHLAPNNASRRWARYADAGRSVPFPVEQAAGAAFAVRAAVFGQIGGFDPRFVPAWFEDVDLCARLRAQGEILYWPHARFRHSGGASARVLGYSQFLPIYYTNALRYRAMRYAPAERWAYRALLTAGMALRLIALPLRRDVPRSRRQAALAYWRTIGVALRQLPT